MFQFPSIKENSEPNFIHFFIRNTTNRRLLIIAITASILQFILFKLFYPFVDFFSDSYSYIFAASANLGVNIWPIGYSKFLMAVHWVTHSDTVLVCSQYFLI